MYYVYELEKLKTNLKSMIFNKYLLLKLAISFELFQFIRIIHAFNKLNDYFIN